MPLPIAVLLSGNGSTLQNLIDAIGKGSVDAEIRLVVASRASAYGLERAKEAGIPAVAIPRKDYEDADRFGEAVWAEVDRCGAALVVLAGFMTLLPIPPKWSNRVMNVHPALIPAFCGKGMYGEHVHRAVLDYGAKITGVTVHFVDNQYDHGPIILQSVVPVEEGDTPETLAERVQEEERRVYPHAVELFAQGRLRLEGRLVRVLPKTG